MISSSKKQQKNVIIAALISIIIFLGYAVYKTVPFTTEWRYESYNDGYRLISYTQAINDNTTEVKIPEQYEGKNVVAIDDKAFYQNNKIKKVVIPDTVTEMGASIFKDCKKIEEITIGKNVTTIGGECFKNCKALKSIVLPDSITHIGGESFMDCSSLESVVLPAKITEIRGNTFENCKSLKSISIPDGVTRIGGHAFYGCSSLSYVLVPDSVKEIGSSAFRLCEKLEKIELPEGVSINERAFKESPTQILNKTFTDEQLSEIYEEVYKNFELYALYNIELGKEKIYCPLNTIVLTTSEEKFKEKHFKSETPENDLFNLEKQEDVMNYFEKAKKEGAEKVQFHAYSQKGSDITGSPYFVVSEMSIDDFINSIEFSDEE